ncbi:MAG: hypothetical protein HKO62_12120 [Gammaproteobacteria bacterium]|nr:hypothetical protein [Gammaproteobacteria bacterium]
MILIVNTARDLIVWALAVHGATLALLPVGGLPAALNLLAGLAVGASFLHACRRARRLPAISRATLDSRGRWRLYAGCSGRWYDARQCGCPVMARGWALVILEITPGRIPVLVTRRRAGPQALRRLRTRLGHSRAQSEA